MLRWVLGSALDDKWRGNKCYIYLIIGIHSFIHIKATAKRLCSRETARVNSDANACIHDLEWLRSNKVRLSINAFSSDFCLLYYWIPHIWLLFMLCARIKQNNVTCLILCWFKPPIYVGQSIWLNYFVHACALHLLIISIFQILINFSFLF